MNEVTNALLKAKRISETALDNKAQDIVIMDMRAVSNITDYFVLCGAASSRRVKTIAEGIEEGLSKEGIRCWHSEGKTEALWVLLDYGDVIAHVFQETTRRFYDLERLWHDAPKERFSLLCKSRKSNLH